MRLGTVREVGALGRVVIPAEMREHLHLEEGTPINIYVYQDKLVIERTDSPTPLYENYEPGTRPRQQLSPLQPDRDVLPETGSSGYDDQRV